jgi:hypothetical protein
LADGAAAAAGGDPGRDGARAAGRAHRRLCALAPGR